MRLVPSILSLAVLSTGVQKLKKAAVKFFLRGAKGTKRVLAEHLSSVCASDAADRATLSLSKRTTTGYDRDDLQMSANLWLVPGSAWDAAGVGIDKMGAEAGGGGWVQSEGGSLLRKVANSSGTRRFMAGEQ